ncbi:MAG: DUF1189 family protein [Candidatus Taylorbacteria bacterium]|nr:DUF1189 family protein [Candidatus Taylorbacteria bacterium]
MKNFIKIIGNSVWSRDFYKKIDEKTNKNSFAYFFKWILVLAIVGTASFSVWILPELVKGFNMISERVATDFPAGLIIQIKGGVASSTPEKFVFKTPADILKIQETQDLSAKNIQKIPGNIIVIDTSSSTKNITAFGSLDTFAYLTKESLITAGNNSYSVMSLSQFGDMTITKTTVTEFLTKLKSKLPYIAPLQAVFLFIFIFIIETVIYLLFCLISTFIFWVLSRVMRRGVTFGRMWRTTVYLATTAFILEALFMVAGSILSLFIAFIFLVASWIYNVQMGQNIKP